MPARTALPRDRRTGRTVVPPLRELVSTAEALALLGVSRRHIYRLTAEGLLPVYKVGRLNRYARADLDALVTRKSA